MDADVNVRQPTPRSWASDCPQDLRLAAATTRRRVGAEPDELERLRDESRRLRERLQVAELLLALVGLECSRKGVELGIPGI